VHDAPANNASAFWNKSPPNFPALKAAQNKDHIFSLSHPTSAVTGQAVRLPRYCFLNDEDFISVIHIIRFKIFPHYEAFSRLIIFLYAFPLLFHVKLFSFLPLQYNL